MPRRWIAPGAILVLAAGAIGLWLMHIGLQEGGKRLVHLRAWLHNPAALGDWTLTAGERCGDAPMLMPTSGFIGFGWGDSFRPGRRHSGFDIFSPDGDVNLTPVVAAYDGYLSRPAHWRSAARKQARPGASFSRPSAP